MIVLKPCKKEWRISVQDFGIATPSEENRGNEEITIR